MALVADFLESHALKSRLEGMFWGRIPDDLLSPRQYEHSDCRPHVFGIELGDDWIKLELYVRSLEDMRCACAGYATRPQQDFIIHFALAMIRDLGIRT